MKRSRDDPSSSSQLKGAAIPSPTEPSRKVQMSTAKSAQKLQTTDALLYLKVVKERFRDKGDMYNEFLKVMKKFKSQRVDTTGVIGKVKELFRGDRDLILGFNAFLPKGYKITLPPEYKPLREKKREDFEEVIGLVNKIKTRFQGDHDVYKAFLGILYNYRENYMSLAEVYQEVSVLFQDHADLLLEFTHYLPYTGSVTNHNLQQNSGGSPVTTAWPIEQKPAADDKYVNCPDLEQCRVSKKEQDIGESRDKTELDYNDNLQRVRKSAARGDSAYDQFHKGKQKLRSLNVDDRVAEEHNKEDTNKNKDDANIERDRYDKGVQRPKLSTMKEKYMAKSIHELDLSNCEIGTPSYRHLPSNYPIPSVRWRTKIGNEVLNDHWVSVTSGSEDYSFKHLHKNPYEDCFNECEDDRFELDMLLETVSATAKHVEELQDSMNSHTFETESSFRIDDYLTAVHLRCIERLYGDYGLEILDMLRKDPSTALPVILPRLKQKQEEWARCQTDLNKIWAETYAKNFHKSLDHRSFYFKQQDTKNLSAKSFFAEIREISEKDQNEDEKILSFCSGYRQPTKPHMRFDYPDPDVQEDLYQLIKYASGEVCTPGRHEKVMEIWTTFLEPVFGVPSRPSVGDIKDASNNDSAQPFVSFGEGKDTPAGEAAASNNCRSSDMSKSGNNEIGNGGSPCVNNAAASVDISCNATVNGVMETESEREEGEISPIKNQDSPSKESGGESDSDAEDEGAESAKRSSNSENGYKIVDVLTTDSADRDGCSPGDHDEDEDDNENDNQDVSEVKVEGDADIHENERTVAFSDHGLYTAKPLTTKLPAGIPVKEKNLEIFYGNDSFYLLFRLHQILYERMHRAKLHSSSPENKRRSSTRDSYSRFKDALHSLLDGSSDNAKFEDDCRTIIGPQSYILFSLDKLIHKLVKQLQTIASEEMENKLIQLYAYERSRSPSKFADDIYHENARLLLPEENLYRIEFAPSPTCLMIQLMIDEQQA